MTVQKVRGWYEKSVVRTVRKIQGTNRPWYETSTNGKKRLRYEKSGIRRIYYRFRNIDAQRTRKSLNFPTPLFFEAFARETA